MTRTCWYYERTHFFSYSPLLPWENWALFNTGVTMVATELTRTAENHTCEEGNMKLEEKPGSHAISSLCGKLSEPFPNGWSREQLPRRLNLWESFNSWKVHNSASINKCWKKQVVSYINRWKMRCLQESVAEVLCHLTPVNYHIATWTDEYFETSYSYHAFTLENIFFFRNHMPHLFQPKPWSTNNQSSLFPLSHSSCTVAGFFLSSLIWFCMG